MYQSLYQYAVDNKLKVSLNKKKRLIAAYILLDAKGNFEGAEVIQKSKRQMVDCPSLGTAEYGKSSTPPICAARGAILCGTLDGKNIGRPEAHEGWLSIMKDGAENNKQIKTIYKFLMNLESDSKLFDKVCGYLVKDSENKKILEEGDYISFRVNGKNVEGLKTWESWFNAYIEQKAKEARGEKPAEYGISCITGEEVPLITDEAFPMFDIAQAGKFKPYVGQKTDTTESYGLAGGRNIPMSLDEALKVKASVEHLMNSENNHSDAFRFMYWFESDGTEPAPKNLFKEIAANGEQDYQELVQSALKKEEGKRTSPSLKANRYHIIRYAFPTDARVILYGEKTGTYGDLYKNIKKWEQDTNYTTYINDKDKGFVPMERQNKNLLAVFFNIVDDPKARTLKEIYKRYGENMYALMTAVIDNTQIPQRIVKDAIHQFNRCIMNPDIYIAGSEGYEKRYKTGFLQILKAYLNRTGVEENKMSATLNEDSTNIGYNLGRLFAVYCQAQRKSAGKDVNANIEARFYNAIKQRPAMTIAMIERNWTGYMRKMGKESAGEIRSLKTDIESKIGESLPKSLSFNEQAAFAIGYDQQVQAFIRKISETEKAA